TPAADNHTPIFEASASACKYFINLVGGSHCGFIPAGSLCDFGEPLGGSLSRANQQAAYLSLTNIWLRQVLKSECTEAEWQSVLQQYNFAESNSNTLNCLPCVSVNEFSQGALEIFPNPVQNKFVISGIPTGVNFLYVRNMHGQCIEVIRVNGQSQIEMQSTLESGVYFIDFENNFGQNRINKFVVLK
ncbi:MAG: T9SS type A sorting domain-containing protein, partial [Bacteroidota bacterium]